MDVSVDTRERSAGRLLGVTLGVALLNLFETPSRSSRRELDGLGQEVATGPAPNGRARYLISLRKLLVAEILLHDASRFFQVRRA